MHPVLAEFDAGAISSDGGVILLREVDRRINLLSRVSDLIRDPRNPYLLEHDQRTMLAQRVLAIACGWEDLNDHDTLRNDLVLQMATDRKAAGRNKGRGDVDPDRPLASAPTLCRLENRVDRQACVGINKLLVELYIESHKADPPKEIILDFDSTAGTWDRQRRLIARIEHTDKGENPRYVVTSLQGEVQMLYEQIYCARGEMENRIKEQQLGLFADRTSCQRFIANQCRLLLGSLAYVLIETLRRTRLAGTELAQAQAGTIRLKLLKIGALLQRSVRRIVIHLSSAFPLQAVFGSLATQLSG